MRILVTAGGTTELIDGVRSIKNTSTGKTGVLIAKTLHESGMDVEILKAAGVESPTEISCLEFTNFDSLDSFFTTNYLEAFDMVIHCAAVSDYKLSHISIDGETAQPAGKIPSGRDLCLHMKPTHKIINKIKELKPNCALIAFKLTNTHSSTEQMAAVKKLFNGSYADLVVFNDLHQKSEDSHHYQILNTELEPIQSGDTSTALAQDLLKIIKENYYVSVS
ncbi:MAG: phosphopantothenoylcysteine decarboxylase [Bdellovibrionota bacterium]|nr:phosphopantothenoylcysteine decarboxylase [Bdellovibrionota bacterium]